MPGQPDKKGEKYCGQAGNQGFENDACNAQRQYICARPKSK